MAKTYLTVNGYNRRIFGEKVYKLALSAAVSCPNRDGTVGTGGCLFCSEGGSGDFASPACMPVNEQIALAKRRLGSKGEGLRYIAYFQSFTGTYGDLKRLETYYLAAAAHPEVTAVAIGTRPDCLGKEALAMLKAVAAVKPLWVELGLQTCHDRTAKLINRGYELPIYEEAMAKLGDLGVHRITHVILGLPGENREAMLETVRYVGERTDGIKLQLLHVLKGTPLGALFEKQQVDGNGFPDAEGKSVPWDILTFEDYVTLVAEAVDALPESVVLHRLTGDGARKDLLAPLWSTDKKRVLNTIRKELKNRDISLV